MQELQIVEGNQRRDFAEIVWQLAERGCCNEFVVRYDCGHALRAEVVAPSFPSTKEYGSHPSERRRYAQHCLHVLTRSPGMVQVQVTVAEGRCRHCQRGQRQTLVCGPVHVDLREPASPGLVVKALGSVSVDILAQGKRIELPMTAHSFLSTVGQVCALPDGAVLPAPSGASAAALETPFAAVANVEELHQWTRKDVEDDMESQLLRYVCCATMILVLLIAECCYLLGVQLVQDENGSEIPEGPELETASMAAALSNLTSVSSLEFKIANSTWMLSALTVAVHKALGPGSSETLDAEGSAGYLWSFFVHPLWVAMLLVCGPLSWLEGLVMLPRSIILAVLSSLRDLVVRPAFFLLGGSTANPILGAALICISLAAITSPIPLTLLAHDLCSVVANLDLVRRLGRAAAKHKGLGRLLDRLHLSGWGGTSRGNKGTRAAGAKKDYKPARSDSGKGEKLQAKDEKSGTFVPSCFVCLDKPSRYILEPCGHRVVCGDCAVQLVDAAARSRPPAEERGVDRGGNCPSCGLAVNRAMRIFI